MTGFRMSCTPCSTSSCAQSTQSPVLSPGVCQTAACACLQAQCAFDMHVHETQQVSRLRRLTAARAAPQRDGGTAALLFLGFVNPNPETLKKVQQPVLAVACSGVVYN